MDYPTEALLREYMRTRWSCPIGSTHGELDLYKKITIEEVTNGLRASEDERGNPRISIASPGEKW